MEVKTFEFRQVSDFLQLNEDEFERFLEDFKIWFASHKLMENQVAMARVSLGQPELKLKKPEFIHWNDDFQVGAKSITLDIEGVAQIQITSQ